MRSIDSSKLCPITHKACPGKCSNQGHTAACPPLVVIATIAQAQAQLAGGTQ